MIHIDGANIFQKHPKTPGTFARCCHLLLLKRLCTRHASAFGRIYSALGSGMVDRMSERIATDNHGVCNAAPVCCAGVTVLLAVRRCKLLVTCHVWKSLDMALRDASRCLNGTTP
jgi:hypothetical protein